MNQPNIVYLVTSETYALMDGLYIEPIGVFSSHEKAIVCIKSRHDIDNYERMNKDLYRYVYDGEMTQFYSITEYEIDKLPEY